LIHSGRRPEYTLNEYKKFFDEKLLLVENHTAGANPTANAVAVAERMFRTIKSQCNTVKSKYNESILSIMPYTVKKTRHLQMLVHKKISHLNCTFINIKKIRD
jgi:hypothetical protein